MMSEEGGADERGRAPKEERPMKRKRMSEEEIRRTIECQIKADGWGLPRWESECACGSWIPVSPHVNKFLIENFTSDTISCEWPCGEDKKDVFDFTSFRRKSFEKRNTSDEERREWHITKVRRFRWIAVMRPTPRRKETKRKETKRKEPAGKMEAAAASDGSSSQSD